MKKEIITQKTVDFIVKLGVIFIIGILYIGIKLLDYWL